MTFAPMLAPGLTAPVYPVSQEHVDALTEQGFFPIPESEQTPPPETHPVTDVAPTEPVDDVVESDAEPEQAADTVDEPEAPTETPEGQD